MVRRWVDSSLWSDPKITDNFTPEDKYFWLFLLTTRFSNLSGCFEVSIKQMSKDMGYSVESVQNLLERFEFVHKLISYSEETKEIFIFNWWKYNWTSSETFYKGLDKFILEIKNELFKDLIFKVRELHKNKHKVLNTLSVYSIIHENDTVLNTVSDFPISISISTPISTTNTNTKNNGSNNVILNNQKSTKKFKKPTLEEIKKYCESRKNEVDPETFFNYYESNGWMVGNNPMRNWKSSIITWERNIATRAKQQSNFANGGSQKESEVKDDGKFNIPIDN